MASKVSLGGLAGAAGAVGAVGAGIGGAMFLAARKASDLGESLSKVETTFGPAAKDVIGQSDELARKFGVVRQESLDAAAAFGLMGQAAGMSKGTSAQLGNEMVKLGLDLASFHNLSNADAFEKIRSGLAGESEPLRPLGILLSEDAVKAEALAMGLTKVKRELTDQEKVLARVSLIRRQAGPARGDLERTKDSAANQLKKLQGEIENAATDFGMNLQGALVDAIKLAHELGEAIRKATGKSVAENVGEMTRGAVNAGRGVVAGHGTEMLVNSLAQGLVGAAGAVGLPVEDARNALKRRMEEMIAESTGQALEVRGEVARSDAQAEAKKKLGEDARAGGARFLAGLRAGIADFNEGQHRQTVDENRKLAFGGMDGFLFKLADKADRDARKEEQENNPVRKLQKERAELLAEMDRSFQSERFGGAGEFASSAIQRALSDEDDTAKKQLERLAEIDAKLKEANDNQKELTRIMSRLPGSGAVLRGAS